eukprot:UC1_evm1s138
MLTPSLADVLRRVISATQPCHAAAGVASLVHASLLSGGYVCSTTAAATTTTSTSDRLPGPWAQDDVLEVAYAHARHGAKSSTVLVVKFLIVGGAVVVNFLDTESGRVTTVDLDIATLIRAGMGAGAEDLSDADNIYTLGLIEAVQQIDTAVHSLGGSHAIAAKDVSSYSSSSAAAAAESTTNTALGGSSAGDTRPPPSPSADGPPPRLPGTFPPFGVVPPRNPLAIGQDDLQPPSLADPSRGGGMIVGPDHPLFDDRRGGGFGGGGGGAIPPPGHPPGARWDPVGPVGIGGIGSGGPLRPGFPGMRGRGRGRGGLGGLGSGGPLLPGDPDPDHFRMPGSSGFDSGFGGGGGGGFM